MIPCAGGGAEGGREGENLKLTAAAQGAQPEALSHHNEIMA